MDYFGVVREAWNLVRRERGLWGLASIEALHVVMVWLLSVALMLPLIAVTISVLPPESGPGVAGFTDTAGLWLADNLPTLAAWVAFAVAVYVAVAVLSVASQAGVVSQTRAALTGSPARMSDGFSAGFKMWWRTAAIMSLPALPGLLYLLGFMLMVRSAIVAPLVAGQTPDMLRFDAWVQGLSPLASVMQLLSLPIAVLTVLALRFGILSDQPWRTAIVSGWRLASANLREVALFALTLYAVILAANVAGQVVVGVVAVGLGLVAWLVGMASGVVAGLSIAALALLFVVVLLAIGLAAVALVYSVAWTILWNRLVPVSVPAAVPAPTVVLGEGIS